MQPFLDIYLNQKGKNNRNVNFIRNTIESED